MYPYFHGLCELQADSLAIKVDIFGLEDKFTSWKLKFAFYKPPIFT